MPKLVKKVGTKKYYEINGIRAAGIIPYYILNKNVYILINTEYRNKQLVNNIIGGKVDFMDIDIYDTMIREFNEETGYLISDKLKKLRGNLCKKKFFFKQPKYCLSLINTNNDKNWNILPELYKNIFHDIEFFNHRDSEELKWVNLFEFEEDKSYLLSLVLYKLRNSDLFRKYDQYKEPLFVDC